MKRLVRSKSGREIYGPKWQNLESSSSENENDDAVPLHPTSIVTTAPPLPESNGQTSSEDYVGATENAQATAAPTNGQTSYGIISKRRIRVSNSHESMYRATVEGDLVAAEMLLEEFPSLCIDEISEEGDRALHVASAFKNKELVGKLVKRMSPSNLILLDGNGYTACCYAAIADAVEIADLMMRKNGATLSTARDRENRTPLYKAAFRGNAKIVSYFLKSVEVEDLPVEEWFDLLLVSIQREMYGVALEISGKNEQLATMRNNEGTALHHLARQRFYVKRKQWKIGEMRQDMRVLAKKLMECIQRLLGHDSAVELMKNPSILHAAAEEGNVELITMLTHTYPHLVWHTDSKGYTIFHIAVIHRQHNVFVLIDEIGARKDLIAVTQDEKGNNILHLAAELGVLDHVRTPFPTFRMLREMKWYLIVKSMVPPSCSEMRNSDGHKPIELFLNEHKKTAEKNRTFLKNTADSWILISTLLFSVVFASTFAVPGGYNQETGIPILFKSNWFTCFVVFEALAMFSSAISAFYFLRAMMVNERETFSRLPNLMVNGFLCLSLSVFGAVSVFMSAYFLVYTKERAVLVTSVIITVYVMLVSFLFIQNFSLFLGVLGVSFRKWNCHSLFKRHDDAVGGVGFCINKLKSIESWIMARVT